MAWRWLLDRVFRRKTFDEILDEILESVIIDRLHGSLKHGRKASNLLQDSTYAPAALCMAIYPDTPHQLDNACEPYGTKYPPAQQEIHRL